MNKIKRRHLAAAKRARKRKGLKPNVPSVEVIHQEEKLPELAASPEGGAERQDVDVSEDADIDTFQKKYSRKRKKSAQEKEENAE